MVLLVALGCKCQTDGNSTGGNGYGQPQAVAERCDVAIPYLIGILSGRINTWILEDKF